MLASGDDPRFEIDAPLSSRLTPISFGTRTAKSALLSLLWSIAVDTADDKAVSITASRPENSPEPVDTVSWWQPVSPSLGLIGTRRDSGPGSGSQPPNGCQPSIEESSRGHARRIERHLVRYSSRASLDKTRLFGTARSDTTLHYEVATALLQGASGCPRRHTALRSTQVSAEPRASVIIR